MTPELGQEPIRCIECGEPVVVVKDDINQLYATCACKQVPTRTSRVLPEMWATDGDADE